jgi:ketosteroid isomerase-like protein
VLNFSAVEVAAQLDTSVAAVSSGLQRARKEIAHRRPAVSQQATLRRLGDDTIKDLAFRYAAAWEEADVDAIVAMLADDATYSMPPLPTWYHGPGAIRAFLLEKPLTYRWRFLPAAANGQLAFATYLWDGTAFHWGGLDVLRLRDTRIADIVSFLGRDVREEFGFAVQLR